MDITSLSAPQLIPEKEQSILLSGSDAAGDRHRDRGPVQKLLVHRNTTVIIVDGSWDPLARAGRGAVIYEDAGQLISAQYEPTEAADPLHAETLALRAILKQVQGWHNSNPTGNFCICSDSQNLVTMVNGNCLDEITSWRAAPTVAECMRFFQLCKGFTVLTKVAREAAGEAHKLANWVR